MKFKSWKRVFSGILAAVTVISTCTAEPVMAASEETETGYPTLQEVIDQLDEDEIVRPSDYIVPVGSDFNIKVDFSNLDVPDWSKVNLYFDDAYNENGEFFTTDHADSYRAVYHVESVSGHSVYQISRNVRVRETEKPKETTESTVPSTNASGGSTNSGGSSTETGGSVADKETGDDTSEDDAQSDGSGLSAADSSGDDSSDAEVNNDGSTTEPNDTTDSSGNTDTQDQSKDLSTESESSGAATDTDNDSSVAEIGVDKEQPVIPGDESSVSATTESLSTESIASEKIEPDEAKPSVLSTIISGIYKDQHTWSVPYETKEGTKRIRPVKIADCKVGEASDVIQKRTKYSFKSVIRQKLNAHVCELCGSHTEDLLEVHEVRNLNELGNSWWELQMKAMRRKTLVVCPSCHKKIHAK